MQFAAYVGTIVSALIVALLFILHKILGLYEDHDLARINRVIRAFQMVVTAVAFVLSLFAFKCQHDWTFVIIAISIIILALPVRRKNP